ncbi:MAG: glycosyltransferase [Candidatus Dormibacteraeota bacterium]|nr:glycosyltransferase [Candidatus Dormibacteraeota bacterium]
MADRLSPTPRPTFVAREGMRVAVISLHTSPTAILGQSANGGLNVYVREVCGALSRRGVATDVFTRKISDRGPAFESLAPLSRVVYLPAGDDNVDKQSLVDHVPAFTERMEEFIQRCGLQYDLIYSHYWLSGLAACCLRSSLRLPWAHTAHTLAVVKNRKLAPGDQPEPDQRVAGEGEIARCADLLVVSTTAEGDELRQAYNVRPERVAVVTPGVDLLAFQPQPRSLARLLVGHPGERLFVFVGRLERLKGVDLILRALARITAEGRHQDVRLLVLGEDSGAGGVSEKARLQALARELGVAGRVDFLGSVAQPRLAAYYAAAEAALMPSYNESFGLAGLEAQASGTAVVAGRGAGLASVLRDGVTGFLVDRQDPGLYAGFMRRLLEEPGLSERLGRNGRRLAERFSWRRTADDLLGRFQGLTAAQAGVQAMSRQE